jgi:hypothetical protein
MNTDQFLTLCGEDTQKALELIRSFTASNGTKVNVERALIPDGVAEAELTKWIERNVTEAIIQPIADGQDQYPGGVLGGRWTWVYRIVHNDGAVTILQAPGH